MKHFAHYADILAVPFFAVAIVYFHRKPERTLTEDILYLFVIVAFLFDVFSAYYVISRL